MRDEVSIARVKAFYDGDPGREWRRTTQSWLEFWITRQMIDRVVSEPSCVLDIGGGPGVYTLDLAASGHCVDLVDLSPANIAFAQTKAADRGIVLRRAEVGNATSLTDYVTGTYDLVLCLGPLYHLLDHKEREQAVNEAIRVLKPGGVAFFAFLSRYAPIYYQLKSAPEAVATMEGTIASILETGSHRVETDDQHFFTDACFVDPMEVASDMGAFGLDELFVFGAEGGMAQNETALLTLDDDAKAAWCRVALRLATTTAGLYGSEHIVYVGRKTR